MSKFSVALCYICILFFSFANASPGNALIISDYLPKNPELAREKALVKGSDIGYDRDSYSGFMITDKEKPTSALYMWYLPARNGNKSAPVIIWLQGGPGASSLFGLFDEIGPFVINMHGILEKRTVGSWNDEFSLLFIDNPLGVGFSFTDVESAMCSDEKCVGRNLYNLLVQFYEMFPDLRKTPLIVAGESYGGKYVPACAFYIHEQNAKKSEAERIPLHAISIGDGALKPEVQFGAELADYFYYLSLLDETQREYVAWQGSLITEECQRGAYVDAFHRFDRLLNGDFFRFGTYFQNVTGLNNYFNVLQPKYTQGSYSKFITQPNIRKALHVGDVAYHGYNSTVEFHLIGDWMRSDDYALPTLLDNYRVLIYNGQLDLILGTALTEKYMRSLQWSHSNEFATAKRTIWKVLDTVDTLDTQRAQERVGGYLRKVKDFWFVQVLGAGHEVPRDQPLSAQRMINAFVKNIPLK